MSVPHLKGGNIFWTCVKDNIIEEKGQYKDILLRGFDYKLLRKRGLRVLRGNIQVSLFEASN